jgi:hypothetical protein
MPAGPRAGRHRRRAFLGLLLLALVVPPARRTVRRFDTIDGHASIGNTPAFTAEVGDLVQWDVIALGDDFHVFHVHGQRRLRHVVPTDSEVPAPSSRTRTTAWSASTV